MFLITALSAAFAQSKSYEDFERLMKEKSYAIINGRCIAFIDEKKVKIKGSEVGYSLQTIEKILTLKQEERQAILKHKEQQIAKQSNPGLLYRQLMKEKQIKAIKETKEITLQNVQSKIQTEPGKLLEVLLKPEQQIERINASLLKKKKSKRKRLHL
jgi:hypothetical protein